MSSSGVDFDVEWGCSFSAGTCRQLYSGVCFIALWGMDIYHYLFRVSVSYGTIVDCINEQFIICGCSLSVACSVGSGYSCHIGLDAMESYLILRAVVLTYIYGICLPPLPGQWLWLLGEHLDFPCCDPVGGAFLGRGAFLGWGGLPL